MANTNVSREEVKSICSGLECSPSQHDATGSYGGKPNITPTGKSTTAATTETTKEFQMTDRGKKIAGFSGRFAPTAKEI
jgi:hypothetical protein